MAWSRCLVADVCCRDARLSKAYFSLSVSLPSMLARRKSSCKVVEKRCAKRFLSSWRTSRKAAVEGEEEEVGQSLRHSLRRKARTRLRVMDWYKCRTLSSLEAKVFVTGLEARDLLWKGTSELEEEEEGKGVGNGGDDDDRDDDESALTTLFSS